MKTEYNNESHEYKINNRIVPSVTQVISNIFPNPDSGWWTETGRQLGNALHLAISLLLLDDLDMDSVDGRISGKVLAFERFIRETGFLYIETEKKMYSNKYNFAGRCDLILKDSKDSLILCDIKSTITPTVDLQLAAYSLLYFETTKKKIKKLCAVQPNQDGSYKMRWVENIKLAERIFLSALNCYNYKLKENLL